MKKNLALLLSIITLILCIYHFRFTLPSEITLAGTKLNDYLYYYEIDNEGYFLNDYTYNGSYLYYLLSNVSEDEQEYKYMKLNIYNNKKELISDIKDKYSNCLINEKIVSCSDYSENVYKMFDLSYKKIYDDTNDIEIINSLEYIPYKDTFLKVIDNKIYISQLGKNTEIIDLKKASEDIFLINYYKTQENVYLLFLNNKNNKFIIYDYNANKEEILSFENYGKYENGFYFYNENTILIKDLKNNETSEYKNELDLSNAKHILSKDNKTFYLLDEKNNFYKVNLDSSTIKDITINEIKDSNIKSIKIYDTLIMIETKDKNTSGIYVLDEKDNDDPNEKITDFIDKQNATIKNKVYLLENNYNVKIHIKEEANIDYPDFYAEVLNNNKTINEALEKMEPIFSKYNKEFFSSFKHDQYKGLNIYLTSTLSPSDYATQIATPAAYSLIYNNEYMIVIDATEPNIEEIICHELLHNLENRVTESGQIFTEWNNLNPVDFTYNNSYTNEINEKYTLNYETNKENVYFMSNYSYTYEEEDRAEIFSEICSCNNSSKIKDYPNLYQKGLYLKEEILNNYPMLKDTNLFHSII